MSGSSWPLVSIGIPLYRARPFVDRIVHNIRSIDYPRLEFVLADQHCADDATSVLRDELRGDPRVRIIESTDELDWIQNYNFVLRAAKGKYFRLLAQDDVIPSASITAAITVLERDPQLALVDGPVDIIDGDGRLIRRDDRARRLARRSPRSPRLDSIALLAGWRHEGANLALIRRAEAIDNGLMIPHTYGLTGLSVRAWLFALSLRGGVGTVAGYVNRRCIHPDSYTARHRGRSASEEIRRLASYLAEGLRAWRGADLGTAERLWGPLALLIAVFVLLPLRRAGQRLRQS